MMTLRSVLSRCLVAALLSLNPLVATGQSPLPALVLAVPAPLDESGLGIDAVGLGRLRDAIAAGLRARGLVVATGLFARTEAEVRAQLIHCPTSGSASPPMIIGAAEGCLSTLAVIERASGRVLFDAVASTKMAAGMVQLGDAVAESVARHLRPGASPALSDGEEIGATGMPVRHLGSGRFAIGGRVIDLHAIAHAHDPAVDPDVAVATNVTLDDIVPALAGDPGHAVITLYQVDPALTGMPSREPGIDRGTDFRDPANLVKAAYTNYVSPVLTDDPAPVRVASHPIGHFFVKIEVPGYPTVLTGMTTIARADTELLDLTVGRQLGIGGVLLTPQPGRLNSAAEVARELALRQRRLRIVDGLYFRSTPAGNAGPEYLFEDGRVVFVRIKLPRRNATDAIAYFIEHIHRGGHNRFGSLLNRPFTGTGAGCSAFAMSWLQSAGIIPFITEPAHRSPPTDTEALGPGEFWRALHSKVRVPWRHLGCDERVGSAAVHAAEFTIFDLLFHGETTQFIRDASQGLAARIRASYGIVPATLFQLCVLTPVRDLMIDARRKDPADRGDYSWAGPGIDVTYWDNSRFAAWIRRVWDKGPRDPRITLARDGRFIGLEIDALGAARQREPFFAAADRRDRALAAGAAPAPSCEAAFDRGLE